MHGWRSVDPHSLFRDKEKPKIWFSDLFCIIDRKKKTKQNLKESPDSLVCTGAEAFLFLSLFRPGSAENDIHEKEKRKQSLR